MKRPIPPPDRIDSPYCDYLFIKKFFAYIKEAIKRAFVFIIKI